MSTVSLYPPLAQIEQRLFAVPDDLLRRLAEDDPSVPEPLRRAALADADVLEQIAALREVSGHDWQAGPETAAGLAEPPAFIQTLIAQKVAASRADFGRCPGRGQLIQLTGAAADLPFAAPLTVLLARQNPDSKVWHGWLVSQDVQYAGFWDFLLQPEDEPLDPACGMVQIWNPVRLRFNGGLDAKPVGRLSPARMRAVDALALEYVLGEPVMPRPRPGFVALRAVGDGLAAVTGTPLGGDADPRHAYQYCYHHVAALLNGPAPAWQAEPLATWGGILAALSDVAAAAWHNATGLLSRPTAPVAHAMNGSSGETIVMLALQDDLHLTLTQVDGRIDLRLVYRGGAHLNAIVIDDGEQARSTTLTSGSPPLEYSGLDFNKDNRLLIEMTDGCQISLPLTLDS